MGEAAPPEDRLKRHDLTDVEWARLGPLLPGHPRQGHRWIDHRLVSDGIFWRPKREGRSVWPLRMPGASPGSFTTARTSGWALERYTAWLAGTLANALLAEPRGEDASGPKLGTGHRLRRWPLPSLGSVAAGDMQPGTGHGLQAARAACGAGRSCGGRREHGGRSVCVGDLIPARFRPLSATVPAGRPCRVWRRRGCWDCCCARRSPSRGWCLPAGMTAPAGLGA